MSEKRKAHLKEIGQKIAYINEQIEKEIVANSMASERLQELQTQLVTLFERYSAFHENSPQAGP
jgi:septation ring formation regulator EzrA